MEYLEYKSVVSINTVLSKNKQAPKTITRIQLAEYAFNKLNDLICFVGTSYTFITVTLQIIF